MGEPIWLRMGAYLAAVGDLSLLEEMVGVSKHWIVFGLLTPGIVFLLLMQRQIRDIRKVKDV